MNDMTELIPNLTSPKDWPKSWKELQTIDSLLRCSVCGEFFKSTTFIPACSHNYCSLCIRRYLCVSQKCPICGISVQDTQLESNRIIDEIVKSFVKIRKELLQVVEDSCNNDAVKIRNKGLGKGVKKKEDNDKSRFFSQKDRTTRLLNSSQKRHRKDSSASDKSSSNDRLSPVDKKKRKRSNSNLESSDSDEISIIENPTPMKSPNTSSGHVGSQDENPQGKDENLVECPVCDQMMAQTKINSHLDTCLTSKDRKSNLRSSPAKQDQRTSEAPLHVGANSFIPQVVRKKPMNKLVYTLLSNTDLKRKLKEYGLSIKGDRQTLVKRHQEFTIMYNSECSKPKPKSVPEIVRLVEEGERKKNKPVENRDKLNFERAQNQEDIDKMKSEYMSQNEDEFTRLINDVKNRKKKAEKGRDIKSSRTTPSKKKDSPSTSKERFTLKLLHSDDDTASNSSGADFEPVKRSQTPRRQLRSSASARSTEKRITRSSAKISQKIIENSCDVSCNTIENQGQGDVCDDPMDPCVSVILPDPPSLSLIAELDEESNHSNESSESESMLPPAFGPTSSDENESPQPRDGGDDGNESEEIEF